MDFIISTVIIIAGVVFFIIFIYRNFNGTNSENGACDCSSCISQNCSVKQNNTNAPDKLK
ncbi:MAG TPA: hypothetical protein PKG60_01585 [Spirochaetota bacterium]|nr:hypothetical protein [Spirochaetota bacterium]HPS85852.1 hypothetical protein [Spirochaetota bacterium]